MNPITVSLKKSQPDFTFTENVKIISNVVNYKMCDDVFWTIDLFVTFKIDFIKMK